MAHLIDKDALVAMIRNKVDSYKGDGIISIGVLKQHCEDFIYSIDTLEVKYDSLENFKSLQHISRDLKSTLQDWGYAPNLYFCDGMWRVSWISCEEGDSIKDFEGNTPEEAIDKACKWFHSTFCNS